MDRILKCIDFQLYSHCGRQFPKKYGTRQLTKGEEGSSEQCCRKGLGQLQHSEVGKGDQQGTKESTELWREKKNSQIAN